MQLTSCKYPNNQINPDCDNSAVETPQMEIRHAGTWLSRLPLTVNWKNAGTSG